MAFNLNNFDKLSSEGLPQVRAIFSYISSSETLATVEASGYFNSAATKFSLGDDIMLNCSDGYDWVTVTATSPNVTVSTEHSVPAGSITNTQISATAAIAFSKLANLTSAHVLLGNASNVATDTAITGDIALTNAGLATIQAGAVTGSKIANNTITTANFATTVLQYTTVTITAAQFNGMYATPKLLVAAGGANTLIDFVKCQLLMTYVSANYASGGVAAIQFDSTANGAGVIASTTLTAATFQAAASTGFVFNPGVVPETFTTCVNKGLYLSNITGAFTTGDSTFVAHVWYRIIPTV